MAALQCHKELRGELTGEVFAGSTTQTNFVPDAVLAAPTPTVPSSSVYSSACIQERIDYVVSDAAGYFEEEAFQDFWSEFLSEDQRAIQEVNQEVDYDQMGRPVVETRKRHKGLLGEVTGRTPT